MLFKEKKKVLTGLTRRADQQTWPRGRRLPIPVGGTSTGCGIQQLCSIPASTPYWPQDLEQVISSFLVSFILKRLGI